MPKRSGRQHRTVQTAKAHQPKRSPRRSALRWSLTGVALIAVLGLSVVSSIDTTERPQSPRTLSASHTSVIDTDVRKVETLDELLALDQEQRAEVDVARANLLCAKAAPGARQLDIDGLLGTLDRWAAKVASETDRHLYQWQRNPAEFNHSEGYFRMLMLVTVLQQDFGVRYNPERISSPDFTNPADLFIHGMVDPEGEGGTCVSIPVVYTAVARRLGYPVNLVTTKAHVFARWNDGKGDRFNIEATAQGLSTPSDEDYTTGATPATPDEIERWGLLVDLDADEALAVFLASLGHVHLDTGDALGAAGVYAQARRLDPDNGLYPAFVASAHSADRGTARIGQRHPRRNPFAHMAEINEINRRNWERLGLPNMGGPHTGHGIPVGPTPRPGPWQPAGSPGVPSPHSPFSTP